MLALVASWYCYVGWTANGERFNGTGMTAAHRTLPFNTLVRVERLDTGKSIIVRINDRGPYIKGRDLDLSKEAFQKLGDADEGLMRVKVTILKEGRIE